ncbi:MAG: 30S ribosomal protein S20 [Planctomycetota bacterium]
MAHSLSAKKRVRQNVKRRAINRARKSEVRTSIKHLESALSSGDVEAAEGQYRKAARKLDKVAGTSTMHKKTAARKKSRLAKQLNSLKAQKGS